jgi:hypothetical protein
MRAGHYGDGGEPRRDPTSTGQPSTLPPTATVATPVFGTAQPPRGLSGALRRRAYALPEHHTRHWLWLLLADRIDLAEHRLVGAGRGRALVVGCVVLGLALLAARGKGR